MRVCDRGPNNTPGCDQELEWVKGKWYSPHYEASHWSRRKKGTAKPRENGQKLATALTVQQQDAKETLMGAQFGLKAKEALVIIAEAPKDATAEDIVMRKLQQRVN